MRAWYRARSIQNPWCKARSIHNSWCKARSIHNPWCTARVYTILGAKQEVYTILGAKYKIFGAKNIKNFCVLSHTVYLYFQGWFVFEVGNFSVGNSLILRIQPSKQIQKLKTKHIFFRLRCNSVIDICFNSAISGAWGVFRIPGAQSARKFS